MSASKVRAGQAFVEIGADPRKFFAALGKINGQVGKIGKSMAGLGGRMAGIGAGLAAPFVASAVAGARFQDVLLNVQASTGATAAELDQVRKAAMAMSQSLGVGPTEAAAGFLELLKAGLSLEQVLGGAGKAAIAFAKVGQMAVADAAVVMADAMNVFKVSGDVAANTLSAAADASSTSIEGIALAFSQVSAVAGLANQSIQDTAASLAVLANAGVKGSDAGTSLKTMLMRLMAPADDAVGALDELGLSVQSFRNADGTMKPMVAIIGTLTTALEGMDQAAKDDIFRRIFGQDAIRAAAVMTAAGVDGFNAMRDSMGGAMSVGDKFATMSSGLSGGVAALRASMERLAIAVSDAVSPALVPAVSLLNSFASGLSEVVGNNAEAVAGIGKLAVGAVVAGAAVTGLGFAIQGVSFGLGGFLKAAALIIAPLVAVVTTAVSLSVSFITALASVVSYAAGSVTAAAATAAAWGLANVPLVAMIGILIALGGLVAGVVMGLVSGATDVASAIGGAMKPSIEQASKAFSDLKQIGIDTFGAIYESINAGDVQGAMQIAMAGLKAAFTTGSNAFLNAVDEWGVNLVNAFDFYISQIPFLRFLGKDTYEFSLFGDSTKGTNADQRADERGAEMFKRRDARDAASKDAQQGLASTTKSVTGRRAQTQQLADLLKNIESASSIEQLQDLYGEFDALSSNGRLSAQQAAMVEAALEDAQERISKAGSAAAGGVAAAAGRGRAADPAGIQDAAGQAAQNQSEVAGSFSAASISGMGFGQSLAQKQLDTLKEIAANTALGGEGLVAA
jgi:TP901 family phage tail tape measure protein